MPADEWWIRLVVQAPGGSHLHLHVEISREEMDRIFQVVDLRDLLGVIENFMGTQVYGSVTAKYSVPIERLPRRGILCSLLGISAEACGSEMILTGATMDIEGDPFNRLVWQVDDENEDKVSVTLEADAEFEVEEGYLVKLSQVMREGVDCFVYESQENVEHVRQPQGQASTVPSRGQGAG